MNRSLLRDNDGRRSNYDRREFCYALHIPERRLIKDRRHLSDRRNTQEWERVEAAIEEIFEEALALGGTLSGEHGIGTAKCRFMEKETSRATMVYSRRIKSAMDPHNILNPGKIIGGQS